MLLLPHRFFLLGAPYKICCLIHVFIGGAITYEEARGLEEIGMIECHTLKKTFPWNIIHGIADNNPNLDLYYFDAVSYLDNRAEDFLHNLLEGGI